MKLQLANASVKYSFANRDNWPSESSILFQRNTINTDSGSVTVSPYLEIREIDEHNILIINHKVQRTWELEIP